MRMHWPHSCSARPSTFRAWLLRLSMLASIAANATSSFAAERAPTVELPAGFRRIESRHLVLYTDLPPDPDVDVLGEVFDQAFPQWCAIFKIDPQQNAAWRMQGCLMKSRERFEAAGLAPAGLPKFHNGFGP